MRQFCQIAVNARYICYGLRAGQIRVLHKDTAMRALLRGHTQQIADMRFAPSSKDDILASFGGGAVQVESSGPILVA